MVPYFATTTENIEAISSWKIKLTLPFLRARSMIFSVGMVNYYYLSMKNFPKSFKNTLLQKCRDWGHLFTHHLRIAFIELSFHQENIWPRSSLIQNLLYVSFLYYFSLTKINKINHLLALGSKKVLKNNTFYKNCEKLA